MSEIVIFGTGGHAKVIHDIVVRQGLFKPVGFVSLDDEKQNFLGLPHYHQSKLPDLAFDSGVVAIGDNFLRHRVVEYILKIKPQFKFITAVHPSAQLGSGVKLGVGAVIMANTAVNSESAVGPHTIINTGSTLDHDCVLERFSSIAPGCTLGGNVQIGEFSAISLGVKIIHGRKVGESTVIGAGAVVIKDVGSYEVAYGNPCKSIRKRMPGDKYL